jgi:hypothetical protein
MLGINICSKVPQVSQAVAFSEHSVNQTMQYVFTEDSSPGLEISSQSYSIYCRLFFCAYFINFLLIPFILVIIFFAIFQSGRFFLFYFCRISELLLSVLLFRFLLYCHFPTVPSASEIILSFFLLLLAAFPFISADASLFSLNLHVYS